jgi:hypothetical protein
MSKTNHFRQYAEEAMRSAPINPKSKKKKKLSSSLRAPGPQLLCRANGFLLSAEVRLSPGLRSERPKE